MHNEDLEKEISSLKVQVAAMAVIVLAQLIFVYILMEEIKLKSHYDYDPIKWERLKRLAIFGTSCIFLVSLYFAYKSYITYRNKPTANNKLFLIAAVLLAIDEYMKIVALQRTKNGENLYAQNF